MLEMNKISAGITVITDLNEQAETQLGFISKGPKNRGKKKRMSLHSRRIYALYSRHLLAENLSNVPFVPHYKVYLMRI